MNSTSDLATIENALAQNPAPEAATELIGAIVAHHRLAASGSPAPLALALRQLGQAQLHIRNERAAIAAWQEAATLLFDQPDLRLDILIDIGGLLCALREGEAARAPLLEAASLLRAQAQPTPRHVWAFNLLASSYQLTKHREENLAALREAEAAARTLAHTTNSTRDAAALAMVLNNIGRAELALGRPHDACATLEDCLHVTRLLIEHGGSHNNLTLHSAVSNKYGRALERTGRLADALPYYTETVGIMRELVSGGRKDLEHDLHHVQADLDRLHAKLAA